MEKGKKKKMKYVPPTTKVFALEPFPMLATSADPGGWSIDDGGGSSTGASSGGWSIDDGGGGTGASTGGWSTDGGSRGTGASTGGWSTN